MEAKGPWQTQSPKQSIHSPLDSFKIWFLPSHPHEAFPHPSLVQLFLAGKCLLTLTRLIPPAKPNSEGFANLLGSQRTVKMEHRFVWLNTIAERQGRKWRTGKDKCLRFYADTAALFADRGLQGQGRPRGSSTCFFIPYLGKSRGAQCGHLALPHLLLPEASSSLSASVSPLLAIGHPGPRKIHITNSLPARLQNPQNTRDRLEHSARSALHRSILLSARRAAGEGGAQLQGGVHLFTLRPRFYTPCWPAAPSSLSALGTVSRPDQSSRM